MLRSLRATPLRNGNRTTAHARLAPPSVRRNGFSALSASRVAVVKPWSPAGTLPAPTRAVAVPVALDAATAAAHREVACVIFALAAQPRVTDAFDGAAAALCSRVDRQSPLRLSP
jgi:hypothetical protein